MRGGAFTSGESNLQSSNRNNINPTYRNHSRGFRCVQDVTPSVAENFEYRVVAHNRVGETESNKEAAAVINCRYLPITTDFNFTVENNKTYSGNFDVYHKLAAPPIGDCTDTTGLASDCLPIWISAQNSGFDNLHGTSNEDGTITTEKDKTAFTYTPKSGFIGTDTFEYKAAAYDPDYRDSPSDWCHTKATATATVIAPSPEVTGYFGSCGNIDEYGKTVLSWSAVDGVSSYKIYKDGVHIAGAIITEDNGVYTFIQEPSDWSTFIATDGAGMGPGEGCAEDDEQDLTYKVESVTTINNTDYESTSAEDITITMVCCPDTYAPTPTLTQSGFCDSGGKNGSTNGSVTVTWPDGNNPGSPQGDGAAINTYKVYRRGPYNNQSQYSGNDNTDWVFQSIIEDPPDVSGNQTYISYPSGCTGCTAGGGDGIIHYDYYVTAVDSYGAESDKFESAHIVQIDIYCCHAAPVTYDQEYTTKYDTDIIDQQLKATDIDADIVSYQIVDPTAASVVTLNTSTGVAGVVTLNNNTGIWSFNPEEGFVGDDVVSSGGQIDYPAPYFTWTATDSCGNVSSPATTKIKVLAPLDCEEYNYIICNAQLPWLTYQQDTDGVRDKIAALTQVPFILNTKGVPSLRKRCGAYNVTRGIDPQKFALSDDDCDWGTGEGGEG